MQSVMFYADLNVIYWLILGINTLMLTVSVFYIWMLLRNSVLNMALLKQ